MKYYRYDNFGCLYRFDPKENQWCIYETENKRIHQWMPCNHKIYKIDQYTVCTPYKPTQNLIKKLRPITEQEAFLEIL